MSSPLITLSARGLWCEAGGFHIDPWRPVPLALITHVHADHARPGSQHYVCAEKSLPLMRERLPAAPSMEGWAYGQKMKLGKTWVSFHSAGHILGSAQVRVECGSEVWVVTGDYKRDADPTCDPFEVVACDTLISEATFALPIYRWQPTHEVAQDILHWWQHCQTEKRAAVLFAYSLGKAQRILGQLSSLTDQEVLIHGALEGLTEAYRKLGVQMPPTRKITEKAAEVAGFAGRLVLAPPGASGSPWMKRLGDCSTAFASGWMQVRGSRIRQGYERGFVISDHADWPGLIRTIRETGAKTLYATHGSADTLARYAREELGLNAQTLKTEFQGEADSGESS